MTTNKPEVVAYLHTFKETPECGVVSLNHDASCTSTMDITEPLIRLSDYEALQAASEALVGSLEQIERWDGFPSIGEVWEESGEPVSYGAAFGSNGERDFMREVARKALAAHHKGDES